jgi:REP element-mobilizing transposase RayT
MPRIPRNEQFNPETVGILHVIQRCVRKAFLAGVDPTTGKDFEYRREWIRERMERLASVFGIDVLTYAILSNHLHIVIRNRPDIVATWSDRDVALRWLRIFPGRRIDELVSDPTKADVDRLVNDPERLKVIRTRLSNPSWYMKSLCEPIARMANKQDEVTGHFWEGRFKAIAITDEAALLACSVYVDLNPIRAAMAEKPEDAVHTSAYDRIHSLQGETISSAAAELVTLEEVQEKEATKDVGPNPRTKPIPSTKKRRGDRIAKDAWLVPLTMDTKAIGESLPSKAGYRASDLGFLTMQWNEYLELLDWTGRQKGIVDKAAIPDELKPILDRLGIESGMWVDLSVQYMKYFGSGRAAGSPESMRNTAQASNLKYARGQVAASKCFTQT